MDSSRWWAYQDEVAPFFAPKDLGVLQHQRVGGDAHVKCVCLGPPLPLGLALLGCAVVGQQLEAGGPLLELHLPVEHH